MNEIILGAAHDFYFKYNYIEPVALNLDIYPHLLLAGASGTGKTYALTWYLEQLTDLDYDLVIADYKGEIKGCNFAGEAVYDGIDEFYKKYKTKDKKKCLVIDEYPAYISFLKLKDQKKAKDVKEKIAEMLMMGRSYKSLVWLVTQRPDADLFIGGARDNLHCKILLGNGSREAQTMMFGNEKIEEVNFSRGEGLYSLGGGAVHSLIIPE